MIKGIIYEITCKTTGDNYIGCTKQTLNIRLVNHRTYARGGKFTNNKLYKAMRKYGEENFVIEPLFIKTVEKAHELREFEGKIIWDRKPTLNTNVTGLHHDDNGVWNETEYVKRYRSMFKDRIKRRDGTRVCCECGVIINKSSVGRHLKTNKHKSNLISK